MRRFEPVSGEFHVKVRHKFEVVNLLGIIIEQREEFVKILCRGVIEQGVPMTTTCSRASSGLAARSAYIWQGMPITASRL